MGRGRRFQAAVRKRKILVATARSCNSNGNSSSGVGGNAAASSSSSSVGSGSTASSEPPGNKPRRRYDSADDDYEDRCCVVCGSVTNLQYCAQCHKVTYCGKVHQAKHWKEHKPECYPCAGIYPVEEANYDEKLLAGAFGDGLFLKSTREMKAYAVMLEETPLMTGPGCSLDQGYMELCLGCTDPILNHRKCSKCYWPVCSRFCEDESRHAAFECEIFEQNGIIELFHPFQYELVRILRCLMLKTMDYSAYVGLNQLDGAFEQRKRRECLIAATTTACIFIRERCKLTKYGIKEIEHMCGVVDLQTQVTGRHRTTMQLFMFPGSLAHSCQPNCRFVELPQPFGENHLMLISIRPIEEGELLTYCLLEKNLPTYQRQLFYQDMYYFTCKCLLCCDPYENRTYFSGVRCRRGGKDCGYIAPKSPSELSSPWTCSTCGMEREGVDVVRILGRSENMEIAFAEKIKSYPLDKKIIALRERIKTQKQLLHFNNSIVLNTKLLLLSKLREHLQTMEKPKTFKTIECLFKEAGILAGDVQAVYCQLNTAAVLPRGTVTFHMVSAIWAYIQWSVIFGQCETFRRHPSAHQFNELVDEALKIMDLEITDARRIIDQMLFMKNNVNVIQKRIG